MTVEVSPPADPLRVLVSRMARGEEEALERLYDASRRSVYGLALRILRDPHVAEEAVVDVYAQAWRQASRFEPRKGAVAAWLLTLARTRAIDLLRSRARRRERDLVEAAPIPDGGPSPLDASGQAERARRVRSALLSLPSEQRRAIEAAFFGALSHTEVARALGAPLGTVKTRIRNGLQTLRRALASAKEGSA
jgi:RNA polymerase sigma-70 factor (ECF subfamily)